MFAAAAFVNGLNHNDLISVEGKLLTATTSLYMAGSLLFVMGSVAFIPDLGCNEGMLALGAVSFIVGSVLYTIGGVVSLIRDQRLGSKQELQKLRSAATNASGAWRDSTESATPACCTPDSKNVG